METETKICSSCKKELPLNLFSKNKDGKEGKYSCCKKCKNEYFIKYKKQNPEKIKYEYDRERTKKYSNNLRLLVLQKLTEINPIKCAKCGIEDIRVLDVDHIDGNGSEERSKITSASILRKIRDMTTEEARKKYQTLCRNCNWIDYLDRKI